VPGVSSIPVLTDKKNRYSRLLDARIRSAGAHQDGSLAGEDESIGHSVDGRLTQYFRHRVCLS
jgi:hypothetical protein